MGTEEESALCWGGGSGTAVRLCVADPYSRHSDWAAKRPEGWAFVAQGCIGHRRSSNNSDTGTSPA